MNMCVYIYIMQMMFLKSSCLICSSFGPRLLWVLLKVLMAGLGSVIAELLLKQDTSLPFTVHLGSPRIKGHRTLSIAINNHHWPSMSINGNHSPFVHDFFSVTCRFWAASSLKKERHLSFKSKAGGMHIAIQSASVFADHLADSRRLGQENSSVLQS